MKSNMVIVHRLSPGGHRYYLAAVGDGDERGEAPGRWVKASAMVDIDREGPVTATQLGWILPSGRGRVPAFDCTFAAPKSVSVLHGLGPPEVRQAVQRAHDDAVGAGLDYLESHGCAVRDRGRAVPGGGLTVAAFVHRVSRSEDPHLHTHALVANFSPSPLDGRLLALHSPLLYGSARAAGAVYQAVLRHHLTASLGLSWAMPVGGRSDAQVVPARVRSGFSGRSHQLLAESGGRIGERALAARVTRPPRPPLLDMAVVRDRWRRQAARMGWQVPPLAAGHPPPDHPLSAAATAVPAPDRWSRGDVMVAVADGCRSGATFQALEAACEAVIERPGVVSLTGEGWHAVPRYSTQEARARRSRLVPSRVVDGQPESIDLLRRTMPGRVMLIAPDRTSAQALEDRTGARASAVAQARTGGLDPRDLVVLIRPHRMESAQLESALRGCRAQVVAAVPTGPVPVGVAAKGPVARIGVGDGSWTAANDARRAADAAIADWVGARRQGRDALLVALPEEVPTMNRRARAALESAGLRQGMEAGGLAVGDPLWFRTARPRLGIRRHALGHVVAIGEGHVTFTVDGRRFSVRAKDLSGVPSAHVVPPVPSLLGSGRELFVIGGELVAGRARGPVHRYVTTGMEPALLLSAARTRAHGHSQGRTL